MGRRIGKGEGKRTDADEPEQVSVDGGERSSGERPDRAGTTKTGIGRSAMLVVREVGKREGAYLE